MVSLALQIESRLLNIFSTGINYCMSLAVWLREEWKWSGAVVGLDVVFGFYL